MAASDYTGSPSPNEIEEKLARLESAEARVAMLEGVLKEALGPLRYLRGEMADRYERSPSGSTKLSLDQIALVVGKVLAVTEDTND